MGKRSWVVLAAATLGITTLAARAADVSGKYAGDGLVVRIGSGEVGYSGTFTLGPQNYSFMATQTGDDLKGSFFAGGTAFKFTGQVAGDRMTLQTGGKTYSMAKDATPPTPGPLKLPTGYALVRRTAAGQFMAAPKPNAATPRDALTSATQDVEHFFDSDFKPSRIAEDNRSHAVMMGFTAVFNGEPVLGTIAARKTDDGMTAFVLFSLTTASKAEHHALIAGGELTGNPGEAKDMPLTPYKFPDGTGSIGLAEGYTTNCQSVQAGVIIKGPADQEISLFQSAPIYWPNATAVMMARQYPVPNALPMVISPMIDPVQAIAVLTPQFSRITQRQGIFAQQIDQLQKVKDMDGGQPGTAAAMSTFGLTRAFPDGSRKHFQVLACTCAAPLLPQQSWLYTISCAAAPDATFKQDLPVMLAMINSLKIDNQQIAINTQKWIADRNAWFAKEQGEHNEQVAAGEKYLHEQEEASNNRLKHAEVFDELIRGETTIVDTTTGEQKTVPMGDAEAVLNNLNGDDPGRYKPLNEVKPEK